MRTETHIKALKAALYAGACFIAVPVHAQDASIYDRLVDISKGVTNVSNSAQSAVQTVTNTASSAVQDNYSDVTGGSILVGNTDAPEPTPIQQDVKTPTSSADLANALPADCDPAVFQMLVKENQEAIANEIGMRERPAPGNVNEYDCLDAIMAIRVGGFFKFPNPIDVFNKVLQAACSVARDKVTDTFNEQIKIATPGLSLPGGVYVDGAGVGLGGNAGGSGSGGATGGGLSSGGSWNDTRFSYQASKPVASQNVPQIGKGN